jgi:AcrR family transcriptional regulator
VVADDLARQIVAAKETRRATKELIYEHALYLFATRSYARTGLRDIAQAVGVEVASLYSHISGKKSLLFDLMEYGTRDLLQRLQAVVDGVDSPTLRLHALVCEHVAINCRRQNQTLVTFNEIRELDTAQRDVIFPLREQITQLYVEAVTAGIEDGTFRPVPARITVNGLLSLERGVATWYDPQGSRTPEDVAALHADQVLRGLLRVELLTAAGDRVLDAELLRDLVGDGSESGPDAAADR